MREPAKVLFKLFTVRVPAIKVGIAGCATTNCNAAAGSGTLYSAHTFSICFTRDISLLALANNCTLHPVLPPLPKYPN